MIYAVDFDGTLCENAYPEIGKPIMASILHFKTLQAQGHKLILWTCREGERLTEAVEWCKGYGLEFDAINENLPEMIKRYGNDCRKIGADYYCDDKNYMPDKPHQVNAGQAKIGSTNILSNDSETRLKRKYERFR